MTEATVDKLAMTQINQSRAFRFMRFRRARWASARLPTYVEWEKAARGTEGAPFPWGHGKPNASRANFAPGFCTANRSPLPGRNFEAGDSPYGCRQIAGNAFEWCLDFFHADTPMLRTSGNLVETRIPRRRVMKGGRWGSGASRLCAAARWSSPPEMRDNIVSFRLVYDETMPLNKEVTSEGDNQKNPDVLSRVQGDADTQH